MTHPLRPSQQHYVRAKDWKQKFLNTDRTNLYDIVTSMFLDCHSDKDVAEALSEQFGFVVSSDDVREIRIAASRTARMEGDETKRRRWCFRFARLTADNLVKEYMLLEGKTSFREAKLALAEEITTLFRERPAHQLWVAVNEAMGRNNISLDLIREFVSSHEAYTRAKAYMERSPWRKDVAAPEGRLEILAQMAKMQFAEYLKDYEKTSRWICGQLGVPEDTLEPSDVDFILDYNRMSVIAEMPDEEALAKHEGDKSVRLRKDRSLDEALEGNVADLDGEQAEELMETLLSRSLPLPSRVERMYRGIEQLAKRRSPDRHTFQALRDMLANHLKLFSADRFFSASDLRKARRHNVSEIELCNILSDLNTLPTEADGQRYAHELFQNPAYKDALYDALHRYFSMRWGYSVEG
jgi:hypothetical protein